MTNPHGDVLTEGPGEHECDVPDVMRPVLARGVVAVLTSATIPWHGLHLLSDPTAPAKLRSLAHLRGLDVLLLYHRRHREYAANLRAALERAGCSRVVMSAVKEFAP